MKALSDCFWNVYILHSNGGFYYNAVTDDDCGLHEDANELISKQYKYNTCAKKSWEGFAKRNGIKFYKFINKYLSGTRKNEDFLYA